jgi:hypothetical protein
VSIENKCEGDSLLRANTFQINKIFKNFQDTVLLLVLIGTLILGIDKLKAGEFDAERAYGFLVTQTDFGPRNPGSDGHLACSRYLETELAAAGATVDLQAFMHYDQEKGEVLNMTNIIGSFYPEKTARLVLCAHWDTRPFADKDQPENYHLPILGANDGASGVAVLLEIARQIHDVEPPVGIDIVFFDGEDYGREGDLDNYCLGSRYFIANNVKYFPKFAILLDMIGDAQLSIPVEGYSKTYAPTVVETVWNIAEKLGIYQFQPDVRGYVFDDHVILNEGGIPAIDIIDFEYPDASHRYWHTLEDTPDKCSPRSLKVVGDVLMELIYYEFP